MALMEMSFKKKKCTLARKKNRTLFRKQTRCCLGSKVGCYSGSKKIDVILDVIKDAI